MAATDRKGVGGFFNRLGPGLLLAATSIGASHLVMSPKAGAMFEYKLLWLVLLTHLFKYHAFEFGPRYAAATGESLIAGYMRLPGPRGWALWIFLFGTIAQGIAVLAGVVGIAAAVLHTFVGRVSFEFYAALVILSVLAFLLFGGYRWLDFLNKVMMIVLFAATMAVFVPELPQPKVLVNFVVPSVPLGSIALVAAIAGWMPTGIDVSVWHSLWTLEKHPETPRTGFARSGRAQGHPEVCTDGHANRLCPVIYRCIGVFDPVRDVSASNGRRDRRCGVCQIPGRPLRRQNRGVDVSGIHGGGFLCHVFDLIHGNRWFLPLVRRNAFDDIRPDAAPMAPRTVLGIRIVYGESRVALDWRCS